MHQKNCSRRSPVTEIFNDIWHDSYTNDPEHLVSLKFLHKQRCGSICLQNIIACHGSLSSAYTDKFTPYFYDDVWTWKIPCFVDLRERCDQTNKDRHWAAVTFRRADGMDAEQPHGPWQGPHDYYLLFSMQGMGRGCFWMNSSEGFYSSKSFLVPKRLRISTVTEGHKPKNKHTVRALLQWNLWLVRGVFSVGGAYIRRGRCETKLQPRKGIYGSFLCPLRTNRHQEVAV